MRWSDPSPVSSVRKTRGGVVGRNKGIPRGVTTRALVDVLLVLADENPSEFSQFVVEIERTIATRKRKNVRTARRRCE